MKMMRLLLLVMAFAMVSALTSCIDDSISSSPNDRLTFSRDTVNFDTVFTDLGTPTARLIVRNPNKKGLNISSIRFKRNDTEFSLNVDGVSGKEFHDVEIRAKDSIFVFIECLIPQGNVSPGLTADDLEFITNGTLQSVRVEAYGQNVTRLRNLRVDSDLTLTADQPYVIFDSLYVAPGAKLNIEPGAQLLFHDGASLVVDGTLSAVGEVGKMIDMRGDRLDNVLPDVKYDIMAGQWKGVRIGAESYGNRMEYVDMRSTQIGLRLDSCADQSRIKLTLLNSWLHNSQQTVLQTKYAKVSAYGCCFSEAAGAVVDLTGGELDFLQCTFANNYLFSAITAPVITLHKVFGPEVTINGKPADDVFNDLPMMKARFANSIVYGIPDDINIGDLTGSQVFFDYVSLKSEGNNDDTFRNCLWDTDPLFYTDRPIYYFNYRLQPDSPVKSAGDAALVLPIVQYDMDGINRLASGAPSLGAYQFTAPE